MEQREARKAAAAAEGADGRNDMHKAKSTPMLAAAGANTPTSEARGAGGGAGLAGGAMGLKGLRDSSSSNVLASGNDLLAGRGRGGVAMRSPLMLEFDDGSNALGSSYSLSHGTSSSRPEGSGGSHSGGSWFSWLGKFDSSREKEREGGEGGGDMMSRSAIESKPRNEHEEVQVEVIRLLVSNYFDIVRNNLADLVPKALMRFLVHHSQRGLQQHLIAKLYRDSLAEELLAERDDVAEARSKARTAVDALQAACATLDSVPSELAATIAATATAAADSRPGARASEGFGGAFGTSGDVGSSSGRRPVLGAERHPSMHIAAQIASATSLGMVGPAASAAAVGNSGTNGSGVDSMPSILEVDVNTSDAMADGGPASVRAFKVEIEEH